MADLTHASPPPAHPRGELIYRQRLPVRLTHWVNVLALTLLLMSGLQIFNAHDALYWGRQGWEARPPVLAIHAMRGPTGRPEGVVDLGPHVRLNTTGVLGWSKVDGQPAPRAFPAWITLPSHQNLASGRRWHFFFAWVFFLNLAVYLAWSVLTRHLQRDLWPTVRDLRHLPKSVLHHLRLRYPRGEADKRYDVLQRLAYLPVVAVLMPLMVLTGLTMSPGMDAAWPWLLDLFGGRQSARTLHFVSASLLVLFVLVHVSQVVLAGPLNELRSMVTGWYRVRPPGRHEAPAETSHEA